MSKKTYFDMGANVKEDDQVEVRVRYILDTDTWELPPDANVRKVTSHAYEPWEKFLASVDLTRFGAPGFTIAIRREDDGSFVDRGTVVLVRECLERDERTPTHVYHAIGVPMWPGDGAARKWLRSQIHDALMHEVDESLWIGGKQARNPHLTVGAMVEIPDGRRGRIVRMKHMTRRAIIAVGLEEMDLLLDELRPVDG